MKPIPYIFGLFLVLATVLFGSPRSPKLGARVPASAAIQLIQLKTNMLNNGDFKLFIITDQAGDIESAHAMGPGYEAAWSMNQIHAGISVPLATPFGEFSHIVTIKAENLDPRNGGIITLTFPHNVILREYLSKSVHLVRDQSGWHAISDQSLGNRYFHTLYLKGNFLPFTMQKVPVGVADVSILN